MNAMRNSASYSTQRGSGLIEVLVSILIFAMGILGILGLQTSTVGVAADARYRTEAAALVDEYVALMSVADPSTLDSYKTGGAAFGAWYTQRIDPTNAALAPVVLPNADFFVTFPAALSTTAGNNVTVTVTWRGASAKPTDVSTHITRTTIPPERPSEAIK
jgi:type IV pilus assembly protein PilV